MLDALVDGEDGEVAGAGEPPVVEELWSERRTCGLRSDFDQTRSTKSGPGVFKRSLRDLRRVEFQEGAPVIAQQLLDAPERRAFAFEFGGHGLKSS